MPLAPVAHVPGALDGEVIGVCGGRLLLVLAEPRDRVELYVAGPDLWRVQLDAVGVEALRALLDEVAGRMGGQASSRAQEPGRPAKPTPETLESASQPPG